MESEIVTKKSLKLLKLFIPERAERKVPLPHSGMITLGRKKGNDIVIDDPSVSSIHAALEFDGKWMQVYDFGSKNGTYVNGERV